jgi:hypothetical protein
VPDDGFPNLRQAIGPHDQIEIDAADYYNGLPHDDSILTTWLS